MPWTRWTAIFACLTGGAVAACTVTTDDDNGAKPPVGGEDAGVGNPTADPPPGKPPGELPPLALDAGGPSTPIPDPSLDSGLPPIDLDAGPPNPPPPEPAVRRIWAVDERRHLLRILAADPSNVVDVTLVDLPDESKLDHIAGVDFRPKTGQLYALSTGSRIFTIDLATAKGTAVGTDPTSPKISGQSYGFDFNPVADKIRVHSDVDQNLRLDPVTGGVSGTDAVLAFAPDDVNFRQSPNLVGSGYTNSVAGSPATTKLYAIDSTRNLLTVVNNPNDGLVTTIGALGVDIDSIAGFDVWGSGENLEAYAAMRVTGETTTGLYRIDLTTGEAKLVGAIAHGTPLVGIAVQP